MGIILKVSGTENASSLGGFFSLYLGHNLRRPLDVGYSTSGCDYRVLTLSGWSAGILTIGHSNKCVDSEQKLTLCCRPRYSL